MNVRIPLIKIVDEITRLLKSIYVNTLCSNYIVKHSLIVKSFKLNCFKTTKKAQCLKEFLFSSWPVEIYNYSKEIQVSHAVRRFALHHGLYRRPTLVPVLANQKKSKEDFCFYEKRQKVKKFSVCFAASPYRGSVQPSRKRDPARLLPWNCTQKLSIKLL